MKAWWLRAALLLLLFVWAPLQAHAQLIDPVATYGGPESSLPSEHDRALAAVYRDEARNLFQSDQSKQALEMMLISLQYDSRHSDGHYELGTHFIEHQSSREIGILYLLKALQNDSFQFGSYGEALYRVVRELLNLGYSETASATLEQFRLGELGQADLYAVRARLALEKGELREAERLAEQGLDRFPDDSRFFTILLERGGQPAFRESRWIERERSSDSDYLAALLRYIEVIGDDGRRRALVEDYLSLGGEDPRVFLSGIDAGLSISMMLSGFLERGGAEDSVLLRHMAFVLVEHGQEDLIAELLEPLNQYSGMLYGGYSESGFYTEAIEFVAGRPVRYNAHPRGVAAAQVSFALEADGLPSHVEFQRGGRRIRMRYADYPVAAQVDFGPAAFAAPRQSYLIIPDRVRRATLRFPEGGDQGSPWPLRLPLPEPDDEEVWELDAQQIQQHSYRLVESDPESERVLSVSDLFNGVPLRKVVDESGDGRIDYIRLYVDGVLVRAVRDLNSDGFFEQVELYDAGEFVATAVDENSSGMYLYLESIGENGAVYWNETGELVRRLWEADEGRIMSLDRFQAGAQPNGFQNIRAWAQR